jgi:hypothetical protein
MQKAVKATQTETDVISGVLLLRQTSWIHFLEANVSSLVRLLFEFATLVDPQTTKVLFYEEDVNSRASSIYRAPDNTVLLE